MLQALYDVMNHPERYRAMWRDGELYIEPIAEVISATEKPNATSSKRSSETLRSTQGRAAHGDAPSTPSANVTT